ncbi:MAG: CHASE2 domain-containing protein [Bacteroidota bacterium]
MSAKKIIFIVLGIITVTALLLFAVSMYKFQSLSDKYVKLKPGMEERIVMVNIGDGDRKYFAEKILEISACNPKVIGVDLFFNEFSFDSEADSLLKASIERSNCIIGTRHGGIGTHGVHKKFLDAASGYGYAELDADEDKYAVEFQVFYDGVSKTDYHFAYQLAKTYDSEAVLDFLQTISGKR